VPPRNLTIETVNDLTDTMKRGNLGPGSLAIAVKLFCAGLIDIADQLARLADCQEELANRGGNRG
jgi:hypothetical protein